ncbi:hypothetical protein XELAEV_18013221mg [Xenopus laevis]|uniref:Retrotransposon gag domain-containing protein n=1 Tax=Xenopus laevis TaxID=8355 RepID=A0A974DNZ6_XENLA|nr:hypothetical protein XELAEV_18013221mg [Xenopus laevis]
MAEPARGTEDAAGHSSPGIVAVPAQIRTDSLHPPALVKFVGNIEEAWKIFKQRLLLYMKATNTRTLPSVHKVALLLTIAGEEALQIFNSFQLGKYDYFKVVMGKFENYCTPKENETYGRCIFNSRVQSPIESIEEYITDLKLKSRTCNFAQLRDSLIRDRLVIGCNDQKVQERFLREHDLTLEKAIRICQAAELKVLTGIRGEEKISQVSSVATSSGTTRAHTSKSDFKKGKGKTNAKFTKHKVCNNCGNTYSLNNCPAFG